MSSLGACMVTSFLCRLLAWTVASSEWTAPPGWFGFLAGCAVMCAFLSFRVILEKR
jgi:hypothetical protein